ncbi:MAG: helix-turn-helix domain-containing protein [Defluviitaleaceae bacterium]|nr:helix-turn-helix domain-containing protein [Defluviitaleaceae bacterium]
MYYFGEIIRTIRNQKGMSQDALADGICDISTLSRIENNHQEPHPNLRDLLLERLGIPPSLFPSSKAKYDIKLLELKYEINQQLIHGRHDKVKRLLAEIERIPNLDFIYLQHIKYVRAIMLMKNKPKEAFEALKEAASMSVKDLSPDKIMEQVLTQDEINMFRNMAICLERMEKNCDAVKMLYALKKYIEIKINDKEGIAPTYAAILFSLSSWEGKAENREEALWLCEEGINCCVEYGTYFSYAGLLYNRAYNLIKLGRKDEAHDSTKCAYYLCKVRDNQVQYEHVKSFAEEHGIVL